MRYFYATQRPDGASAKVEVHRFPSIGWRNRWVKCHASDGGADRAIRGATVCTCEEAYVLEKHPHHLIEH